MPSSVYSYYCSYLLNKSNKIKNPLDPLHVNWPVYLYFKIKFIQNIERWFILKNVHWRYQSTLKKCPLTVSIHTEWTNYINNKSTSTYFIKNVVGWETNWRNKLLVYIPNFYFFHLLRMVCIFLIWFMRYWCKTLQEGLYDRVAFFVVITRINFWQVFQSITRKLFWIFDFWNTTNAQSFSNSFFELLRNFFQLWDNIFYLLKITASSHLSSLILSTGILILLMTSIIFIAFSSILSPVKCQWLPEFLLTSPLLLICPSLVLFSCHVSLSSLLYN